MLVLELLVVPGSSSSNIFTLANRSKLEGVEGEEADVEVERAEPLAVLLGSELVS